MIFTCRLIEVCDAGMGVALIQFVIDYAHATASILTFTLEASKPTRLEEVFGLGGRRIGAFSSK